MTLNTIYKIYKKKGCSRAKNGSIQPDPDRFPDGIKALADNLHELGFTFGLYTSAGSNTCSGGTRPCHPPGSYGHYTDDANTFATWGVYTYIKEIYFCANFHVTFLYRIK